MFLAVLLEFPRGVLAVCHSTHPYPMESLKPTLSARRETAHPPEIVGLRRCVGSHERVPAQELPVPETKEPERKNRRANKPHYEVSVEEFETNVHPACPCSSA